MDSLGLISVKQRGGVLFKISESNSYFGIDFLDISERGGRKDSSYGSRTYLYHHCRT